MSGRLDSMFLDRKWKREKNMQTVEPNQGSQTASLYIKEDFK